jgi:hypothetical protein
MFASAFLASCGGADVDVKAVLSGHMEQMKQCYNSQDANICDSAIAVLDKDIPLLKNACSSGNGDACGLFPGYDQIPEALRSYKKMCIDDEVDPSIPDNLKQIARQALKAPCDKMKAIGQKP